MWSGGEKVRVFLEWKTSDRGRAKKTREARGGSRWCGINKKKGDIGEKDNGVS